MVSGVLQQCGAAVLRCCSNLVLLCCCLPVLQSRTKQPEKESSLFLTLSFHSDGSIGSILVSFVPRRMRLRLEVRGERLKPEERKQQGSGIDIKENRDIRKRLGNLEILDG